MHGNFFKHCEDNELEGVNYCLSRGFDVNSKYNGMTGPMFACESGNSAIVSRLVQVSLGWISTIMMRLVVTLQHARLVHLVGVGKIHISGPGCTATTRRLNV